MQNEHFILLLLNVEVGTPHGACKAPLGLQKYETKILRSASGLGKSDFGFSLNLFIYTNIAEKFIP